MRRDHAQRRTARRLSGRLAGALIVGVVVVVTQSPTSPRLAGAAPPPNSALSLWYRAPASDHPLLISDGKRTYLSWMTKADGYRFLPLEGE